MSSTVSPAKVDIPNIISFCSYFFYRWIRKITWLHLFFKVISTRSVIIQWTFECAASHVWILNMYFQHVFSQTWCLQLDHLTLYAVCFTFSQLWEKILTLCTIRSLFRDSPGDQTLAISDYKLTLSSLQKHTCLI